MSPASRVIDTLRHSAWLRRDRIVAWTLVVGVCELAFLVFVALWQHGAFGGGDVQSSDFLSFYAAGKMVLAGTPALVYDQHAHLLIEQAIKGPDTPYQFFFYPPLYLPLCALLATLPYYVAFAIFQAVSLAAFLIAARSVLRETRWGWLAPVLAFPAVLWNIGLGQNAFLTAALLGGFSVLLDRKPATAGVLMGLLCYKPHFGILAPFALIAGGRWRAFFAAAATVVTAVLISLALFGLGTWEAFLDATINAKAVFGSGRIDYAGIVTVFGAERLMGFANGPAYALQAIVTLEMVTLVVMVWHRDASEGIRFAILFACTLLALPVALLYDQMILLLALLWFVREARETGFLSWERFALAAMFVITLIAWPIGARWHLPLGPLPPPILLLLCVRRQWRARAARPRRTS